MARRRRRREANRRSIIDNLETTPATVSSRRASSGPDEPFADLDFDWRPQPLERAVQGDRSFRWPIIGAALVLGAIAILLVRGLGTFSDAQAAERLETYRAEVDDFSAALGDLEAALPAVSTQDALAFAEATDELRAAASEELPGLPPFVPQGSLGEVSRARDHLLSMTDVAMSVSADLAVAADYTDASETIFAVPPLPFTAPEELIGNAAEAITDMETETRTTLARLEPTEEFVGYVESVEEALEGIGDWADRYLLALRRGDAATAEALVAELQAEAELLEAELEIGLETIARTVENRLAELRAAVVEAEVLTATGA